MAACRLQCWVCGIAFYGRADARYCCGACRQKAYKARIAHRAAVETVLRPEVANTVAETRQIRQQARAVRERAGAVRRAAAKTRAELGIRHG